MKRVLFLLCITSSNLFSASISGVVFNDTNGNGIRESSEAGLKGVTVSDQVNVVLTDANGFYRIPAAKGYGFVMISLPSGFKAVRQFFHKVDLKAANNMVDFALIKGNAPTRFTFVHASDTHISDKSIDRMDKFRALVDSLRPDFVLITGDLVKDALRVPEKEASTLYELYKNETLKITAPVWNVPGNHEIFGIERELSKVSPGNPLYGRNMYRSYLGPDYYSFNYGGIHFVGLNSLEFDDMWYYGSIDSLQRDWLKKDLANLAPSTPVVTFQHVPFLSGGLSVGGYTESGPGRTLEREKGVLQFRHVVSNAAQVIGILQQHPYPLALAGHHHSRQLFFLEMDAQQTRFEQTAAVIGPSENNGYKSPSGIVVYQVTNGDIGEGVFIKIK